VWLATIAVASVCGHVAAAQANGARIVAEKQIAPRVIELTISTPAFTTLTHVDVDLPTGYDADTKRRWPATYVLAGTMNTYRTFNDLVDGVKLTQSYPSIVVSPSSSR
jgi:diacylglycerol O-acyltransferase/trehalose O-mycolyltransferase